MTVVKPCEAMGSVVIQTARQVSMNGLNMGIRNKIALTVNLLFGVFLIVAAVLLIEAGEARIRNSVVTQQTALVKTLTYGFDQQVLARHKTLINVAEGMAPSLIQKPAQLQTFIAEQIVLPKLFTNILVYGPDGTILAAYPNPEKYVGSKRLAGMEYVQHTLTHREPYISKLFVSPVSGEPLIVMTAPVLDANGKLIAFLGGSQYVLRDNLFSGFTANPIGRTGSMQLLTRDRIIISHTDKTRLAEKLAPGANQGLETALKEGHFAGETVSSRGIPVLMTVQTMQSTGWVAGATLPLAEAYEPITAMRQQAIKLVVMLLLVLPLLVWLVTGVLSRPLLGLRDRIMQMAAQPQTGTLLEINRNDEIGELAAAFDNLTLARRSAELSQRHLNRALRLLSDCNQTLIHAEEEQHLLDDICQLIIKTGGYPFAWVGYADPDGRMQVVAKAGDHDDYLAQQNLDWKAEHDCPNISGLAILNGSTQICTVSNVGDTPAPWQQLALAHDFHAGIALPLKNEAGNFGVLTIYAGQTDHFSADEVLLLEELAADLTFGIGTLRARKAHLAAEQELAFLAHHDPLTRLPNRLLLRDRFEQAALMAQRTQTRIAMLFLDLDNFKEVNDSLGHGIGDELLINVVRRLQTTLRDVDTISREGGDEFVVLLTGIQSASDVSRIAQSILDTMAQPFEIGDHTLHTSFSIGVSLYPNDGENFDVVRKNADTALYRAKDSGRRNYRFFSGQMNLDAQMRMQMQNDLRKALRDEEFLLHYQPQICLADNRVVGLEALLRWQKGDTLVPPKDFIPVAEHSGLIVPIGEWVLNVACHQAMAWQQPDQPELVVAVNLSALQFKHGNIIDTVSAALKSSGLPPHLLELELTESILLQDVSAAMKILHDLHTIGVKLSIDDFGTGYSSLSYLKRLSVDKLKVDQSFVRDIADDTDDAAIVTAIIQLGHTLNLEVIAEGVETDEQLAFLKQSGCDEVQGYLFSRPLPAAQIPSLLARLQP